MNLTWRESHFLVILLVIYYVTSWGLTSSLNALFATIALSGDP